MLTQPEKPLRVAIAGLAVLSISLASCSHSAPAPVLLARASRPAAPAPRASRTTGTVTQVRDGNVTIDLGSVDGLTPGSEVEIVRARKSIGRLTVTNVDQDHTSGPVPPKFAVQTNDEVRVSEQAILRTTLDQIDKLVAGGNTEVARRIAAQAKTETTDPNSLASADWNNLGVIAELHGHRTNARMLYTRALRDNPPASVRQSIESNLTRVEDSR